MPQQTVTSSHNQEQTEERGSHMEKDDLLTIREVAQRLRVDTTTVRRWISLRPPGSYCPAPSWQKTGLPGTPSYFRSIATSWFRTI